MSLPYYNKRKNPEELNLQDFFFAFNVSDQR